MADLEGILSLHFLLPEASKPDSVPPGLTPEHKAAMVMFLERVYGIDTQEIFFRLIENGFLADLRTSTTLDTVSFQVSLCFLLQILWPMFVTVYSH